MQAWPDYLGDLGSAQNQQTSADQSSGTEPSGAGRHRPAPRIIGSCISFSNNIRVRFRIGRDATTTNLNVVVKGERD
jgi:hypothetical protein